MMKSTWFFHINLFRFELKEKLRFYRDVLESGVAFMLGSVSDAKSGSGSVYKQVVVEIPRSGFLACPVLGLRAYELCVVRGFLADSL